MANNENKKLQRWFKKLMQEQERERKKIAFLQQKNTRVNLQNYCNYSKPNSSFSYSSSYGGYFGNYGFSYHSSRPQRAAIANGTSVVVKTNYTFAGHSKNKAGKRLSGAEVISKAQANVNYITRDSASQDINDENLSMLYNSNGKMLDNDEYATFKSDLKEMDIAGFRRIVISPEDNFTREEMKDLVTESLRDYARETGKEADSVFSIHTNTEHIHAHVLIVSEHYNDLKWSQNDLGHFKEIVSENTRIIIDERELMVDKTIEQELEKVSASEQEITKEKEQKNEFSRTL